MPYQTGLATSAADLVDKIKTFAAANGFVQGNNALESAKSFTDLTVQGTAVGIWGYSGPEATVAQRGPYQAFLANASADYPCTYHLFCHGAPLECFCVVQTGQSDYYNWLAFGELASAPGHPGGAFYAGSQVSTNDSLRKICFIFETGGGLGQTYSSHALFWETAASAQNSHVLLNSHGMTWFDNPSLNLGGNLGVWPLLGRQPNAWNGQSVLLPIRVTHGVAGEYRQDIGSVPHARYLRVDNYNPGDVIALGPDRWKVFPFARKDVVNRNQSVYAALPNEHTGTYGWALRYDGP